MAMWNNHMVSSHVGPKNVQPRWWWVSFHGDQAHQDWCACCRPWGYLWTPCRRPVGIIDTPAWDTPAAQASIETWHSQTWQRENNRKSRCNNFMQFLCGYNLKWVLNSFEIPRGCCNYPWVMKVGHRQTLVKISGEDAALFWTPTWPCFNIFRHI